MASFFSSFWERAGMSVTPTAVADERREHMADAFIATTAQKYHQLKRPVVSHSNPTRATFPTPFHDNWAAAWKLRRHWEEETEKRKALGKPVY